MNTENKKFKIIRKRKLKNTSIENKTINITEERTDEKSNLDDDTKSKSIFFIAIIAIILVNIIIFAIGNKNKNNISNKNNYTSNYTNTEAPKVSTTTPEPNIKYTEVVLDKQVLYQLGYNPADKKNFTSVKIPATYEFKGNHYKITKIGEKAFYNYGALQKVTIEEGVQILGVSAFENCTALTTVNLPSSINKINNNVFANCKALKKINIPNEITEIRDSLFYNCISLSEIEIPNSVNKIGDMAFYKCKSLKKISLPENLTYIGTSAFAGCRALESLNIPSSCMIINKWAFSNCVSLNKVIIPDEVQAIGEEAFCNVPYVYYDGSASGQPWGALDSNKMPEIMIGGITIGDSVEKVKEFYGTPESIYGNYLKPITYYSYRHSGITFEIMNNTNSVSRITVGIPGIKTPRGIQVGDSIEKLKKIYGNELEVKEIWEEGIRGPEQTILYHVYEKNVKSYPKYLSFMPSVNDTIAYIFLVQDDMP